MVTVKVKIPIAVLQYFEDYGGYLLTGFNLHVETTSPNAFEVSKILSKRFTDKLLVPSNAEIKMMKERVEIKYGEWKIVGPKNKIEVLPIDNFEVSKFAEFLKKEYKLEKVKVEKGLSELWVSGQA